MTPALVIPLCMQIHQYYTDKHVKMYFKYTWSELLVIQAKGVFNYAVVQLSKIILLSTFLFFMYTNYLSKKNISYRLCCGQLQLMLPAE